MDPFLGVKIALFCDDDLLVYLRDDRPDLKWAGLWDLPGGGRENNETPVECVLREVNEEFSIQLSPDAISWQKEYPSANQHGLPAYFMAGKIAKQEIKSIKFGEEGQRWQLMKVNEFLASDAVPYLKVRIQDYLNSR